MAHNLHCSIFSIHNFVVISSVIKHYDHLKSTRVLTRKKKVVGQEAGVGVGATRSGSGKEQNACFLLYSSLHSFNLKFHILKPHIANSTIDHFALI